MSNVRLLFLLLIVLSSCQSEGGEASTSVKIGPELPSTAAQLKVKKIIETRYLMDENRLLIKNEMISRYSPDQTEIRMFWLNAQRDTLLTAHRSYDQEGNRNKDQFFESGQALEILTPQQQTLVKNYLNPDNSKSNFQVLQEDDQGSWTRRNLMIRNQIQEVHTRAIEYY
ncbi:MAG: hypothetical protein MRY78_16855 [Saprospiraceae bacterium]|nr:hypothetical protein [Saprospiraceae bacterium]